MTPGKWRYFPLRNPLFVTGGINPFFKWSFLSIGNKKNLCGTLHQRIEEASPFYFLFNFSWDVYGRKILTPKIRCEEFDGNTPISQSQACVCHS